jgi:hypothetical protein
MKKYPLSTKAERIAGIAFSILAIAVLGLLLYALRSDLTILLLTSVGVVFVVVVLVLYMMNVTKAVIVYDPEGRTLKVQGFRERTIDLNKVACLQTLTVKSGHVESRSLAFSDAEGNMVAVVPTYFTSKRGVAAEPMAKAMAADLGIDFQANVPEWEYDEEARKAHEIEVAKQEKEDAKKRREAKAALRVAKLRKKYGQNKTK